MKRCLLSWSEIILSKCNEMFVFAVESVSLSTRLKNGIRLSGCAI